MAIIGLLCIWNTLLCHHCSVCLFCRFNTISQRSSAIISLLIYLICILSLICSLIINKIQFMSLFFNTKLTSHSTSCPFSLDFHSLHSYTQIAYINNYSLLVTLKYSSPTVTKRYMYKSLPFGLNKWKENPKTLHLTALLTFM